MRRQATRPIAGVGVDLLRAELRYRRERRDLYAARLYAGRATSTTRLNELKREVRSAEIRVGRLDTGTEMPKIGTTKGDTMGKPNRYDVARVIGEQSPATTTSVATALDIDSSDLKKLLQNASKHGLIEPQSGSDSESESWEISKKGKRRVAAKA
jgi:hypothetical protein